MVSLETFRLTGTSVFAVSKHTFIKRTFIPYLILESFGSAVIEQFAEKHNVGVFPGL